MIDFNDINYDDKQIRFDSTKKRKREREKKRKNEKKLFDMYL